VAVETDVTDEDSVAAAVESTVKAFGGLDCVVNNAGGAGPVQPFDRVDREAFMETKAVNVAGPLACVTQAASHLRASDHGSVVNIASTGGNRSYPSRTPSAASKMALIGLTLTLLSELGRDDVTANTVLPGPSRGTASRLSSRNKPGSGAVDDAEPAAIGPGDVALEEFMVSPRTWPSRSRISQARTPDTSRPRRSASTPGAPGTDGDAGRRWVGFQER
jgi:NAD(P)-dependent dehydrogenase (short-subunit alcohol dehydrogenase family)